MNETRFKIKWSKSVRIYSILVLLFVLYTIYDLRFNGYYSSQDIEQHHVPTDIVIIILVLIFIVYPLLFTPRLYLIKSNIFIIKRPIMPIEINCQDITTVNRRPPLTGFSFGLHGYMGLNIPGIYTGGAKNLIEINKKGGGQIIISGGDDLLNAIQELKEKCHN